MPNPVLIRRLLTSVSNITWLLNDSFNDTLAAGAVNGTLPTPGPGGARTVVTDTNSILRVSSGALNGTGVASAYKNPLFLELVDSRVAGRVILCKLTNGYTAHHLGISNSNATIYYALYSASTPQNYWEDADGGGWKFDDGSGNSNETHAFVLRTTGVYWFRKLGVGVWELMYISKVGTFSPVYVAYYAQNNATLMSPVDFFRSPINLYLPQPLCFDDFSR